MTATHSVQLADASLQYVEQGRGTPLFFVHGSASDHRTWRHQVPAFAERFRVIAYSRRYHWPNQKIPSGASYAMVQQVDDLAEVVRSLDAHPVHLVGHSYGALVCLVLAAREPELVRSLVLAEPPSMGLLVSIPPRPAEILRLALRSPRTAAGIARLGAFGLGPAAAAFERNDLEAAMRLTGTAILGRQAFENLDEERAAQVRDNLIGEELISPEFLPRLDPEPFRRLTRPVLLLGGARSPRVFARLLDHLEALLPSAERAEIPGASHLMHEDNAPSYNATVLSFLSKHES